MVRFVIPPLTQSELNGAADAAAAIVMRCNMVPEDGFVGPEDMLDQMYRKVTRGVTLKLDLEGLCAALAHPSIRHILELRGFKFQDYEDINDHSNSGQTFWMHRIGSSINDRKLPPAGSAEERDQI